MMVKLHPEILSKDGKKQFVVIPYEEFEALQELIGDLEDLQDFADAKAEEGASPTVPWEEVKHKLNL